MEPLNLRIVAFTKTLDGNNDPNDDGEVHLYWNLPDNFPDGTDDDPRTWTVRVERIIVDPEDSTKTIWVPVQGDVNPDTAPITDYALPQFSVSMDELVDLNEVPKKYGAPDLIGDNADSGRFRVLYVNPGKDDDPGTPNHDNTDTDDDVEGEQAEETIPLPLTPLITSPAHCQIPPCPSSRWKAETALMPILPPPKV